MVICLTINVIEVLTCTFGASCYNSRLSWAHSSDELVVSGCCSVLKGSGCTRGSSGHLIDHQCQ